MWLSHWGGIDSCVMECHEPKALKGTVAVPFNGNKLTTDWLRGAGQHLMICDF